jgi:hypothetical protein
MNVFLLIFWILKCLIVNVFRFSPLDVSQDNLLIPIHLINVIKMIDILILGLLLLFKLLYLWYFVYSSLNLFYLILIKNIINFDLLFSYFSKSMIQLCISCDFLTFGTKLVNYKHVLMLIVLDLLLLLRLWLFLQNNINNIFICFNIWLLL